MTPSPLIPFPVKALRPASCSSDLSQAMAARQFPLERVVSPRTRHGIPWRAIGSALCDLCSMTAMREAWRFWRVGLALVASTLSAAAQQSQPAKQPDLESFKLITERNIFNANRSGARPRSAPRVLRVDSFALVGILASGEDELAFFDSSNSEYRKAVRDDEVIAGYTVAGITPASVKLTADDQELEMKVGMQLRRENEGQWELRVRSDDDPPSDQSRGENDRRSRREGDDNGRRRSNDSMTSSASGPSASGAAPGTGSDSNSDEVLKRLMREREAENR